MGRFDYPRMIHEALRQVVRLALTETVEGGLEGDHHFFITFDTAHPGVQMHSMLRDLHPDRMTVVIQKQFWNLEPGAEAFSVTLSFDGVRRRLTVPYEAIESFVDPGAEFGLRFDLARPEGEAAAGEAEEKPKAEEAERADQADEAVPALPDVVRLEDFRKKEK